MFRMMGIRKIFAVIMQKALILFKEPCYNLALTIAFHRLCSSLRSLSKGRVANHHELDQEPFKLNENVHSEFERIYLYSLHSLFSL